MGRGCLISSSTNDRRRYTFIINLELQKIIKEIQKNSVATDEGYHPKLVLSECERGEI